MRDNQGADGLEWSEICAAFPWQWRPLDRLVASSSVCRYCCPQPTAVTWPKMAANKIIRDSSLMQTG